LAVIWNGIVNAIKFGDPTKNFMDKIVIDVTNPLDFSKDILPKLAISQYRSAGETVHRLLPDAKVIKTLNIVGNPHMVHPEFPL
jgi:predicted dinucleotide-binding enzyme